MPRLRENPLLDTRFALAERMAMTLDGEAYAIDESHALFDEPETGLLRAAALAFGGLHERLIAERWTAAWLWCALPSPPPVHTFCVSIAARVQHHRPRTRAVREVVIDADDITRIGEVRVTTPARTAVDLARIEAIDGAVAVQQEHERRLVRAIRELVSMAGVSTEQLKQRMPRGIPERSRSVAIERFRLAAAVDPNASRGASAQLEVTR